MTPLFDTKRPHDPFAFLLDEGLSGPRLHRLLTEAKLNAIEYGTVLPKNTRTPDDTVLSMAQRYNYAVITKDKAMERDEVESIITHNAKLVILTDTQGGVPHFAAAIIVAHEKVQRAFLDGLHEPVVVRLSREGTITKIRGADELRKRHEKYVNARIARGKLIQRKHQKLGTPPRTWGVEG